MSTLTTDHTTPLRAAAMTCRSDAPRAPAITSAEWQRALDRGVEHLAAEQGDDGSWRGEYGGPMFLAPMYVAACHIAGHPIGPERRAGLIATLRQAQNVDGSIGLHAEAPGCMFTSALGYAALRRLGVEPDEPSAARLRRWIRSRGTPLGAASWGKLVLCLLGLYDYDGLHPILPELWLLPRSLPVHPSRLWCHCRQVYLPMAFLYATRAQAPTDRLTADLRSELYDAPWGAIRFADHRDTLAESDRLVDASLAMRASNWLFGAYEQQAPASLRQQALASVLEHIDYEDRTTNFIRIGPVNAVLNTIVHCFRRDPGSGERVARSLAALDGYLWHGPNGVVVNGYNSTALWDTAFAVQALFATGRAHRVPRTLARANDFIRENQVLEDVPERERFFRHRSAGGWPFSDRPHGWPISDCTAEGLKAALLLEGHVAHPVPAARLGAAVELLLSWQNDDGGWATYENRRGPRWLERLNPSQVFSDIMVDYSYVECTSACVQALVAARRRALPVCSAHAVDRAIERGRSFLRRAQRADGSFEGSWAVCFTYGTWFGLSGLADQGRATQASSPPRGTRIGARGRGAVERAADFLERVQRVDGSWGEHFTSTTERRYVQTDGQVVNTSWALLGLARAGRAEGPAALRGARHLLERQQADGSWPRQNICGVFNKTTLIHYDNYRRYFPLWALGLMAPRS